MNTHKDLDVWKCSIDLVVEIYRITRKYPGEGVFGITRQMRNAASSIPFNISEGAGRQHTKEYIQFLYIARGSITELETQCIVSERLTNITKEIENELQSQISRVRALITGLIKRLQDKLRE